MDYLSNEKIDLMSYKCENHRTSNQSNMADLQKFRDIDGQLMKATADFGKSKAIVINHYKGTVWTHIFNNSAKIKHISLTEKETEIMLDILNENFRFTDNSLGIW